MSAKVDPEGLSLARDYTPPVVRIVSDGRTTGPEPPLEGWWSDLEKLRWLAAVVEAENPALKIRVGNGRMWIGEEFIPGTYDIHVSTGHYWTSSGAGSYDLAWIKLTGIGIGASAMAKVTP